MQMCGASNCSNFGDYGFRGDSPANQTGTAETALTA
ncbi:hypothetical protein OKW43_005771 [Paraburkholderia sp. WC7.3g]